MAHHSLPNESMHTPGPWHLVEKNNEIRIYPDWDGRPGGVALGIGSVSLTFRPRRQGSHRGEKMVYRPFSEQDRADARLIAAAPDLLASVCEFVALYDTVTDLIGPSVTEKLARARAAIAKAEGRS